MTAETPTPRAKARRAHVEPLRGNTDPLTTALDELAATVRGLALIPPALRTRPEATATPRAYARSALASVESALRALSGWERTRQSDILRELADLMPALRQRIEAADVRSPRRAGDPDDESTIRAVQRRLIRSLAEADVLVTCGQAAREVGGVSARTIARRASEGKAIRWAREPGGRGVAGLVRLADVRKAVDALRRDPRTRQG